MRATRRTFRTAAIVTGTVAALAVPTAAAFADTPPTPQPSASDDQGRQTDQNEGQNEGQAKDQDGTQPPVAGGWESKGSVDIGDGWSAKVDVNASARSARAQIAQNGAVKGTLEAYDGSKSGKFGAYTITLSSDGSVSATKDKDDDATKPPVVGGWEDKGTVDIGDGWSAKVQVNASARSAKADILKDGAAKGHLNAYDDDSDSGKFGKYTVTLSSDGSVSATKDKDGPVVGGWEDRGTVRLGNGWSAKIKVNSSARSAKADILRGGAHKGHLKAYDGSNQTKIDNYTFTLTSDGKITAKKNAAPKPKPKPDHKRVYVKAVRLADGSVAKVYKLGTHHYQADIYARGAKLDTLDADGRTAFGENNGLHVALKPDGTVTSWLDGSGKNDGKHDRQHKPQPRHDQRVTPNGNDNANANANGSHNGERTLPRGGVKAGAENVSSRTSGSDSDETPLIAASAGAAAVGAAGLGFALYRRKNND
ncbi:hypothetical protein [Streptomyces beihaiensis]|uniref:Gram-positive cocci surface proteins LPxTG domain-containing protein n=1 Tax=Streptomyces beihaiensis TaxID=2984495 RepID=A0ABT3TZ56_9ACTN|nr:hypothetical protein [Streptomyces beihaiensis]MCX3062330.1 hypothetical protein [Streptomyces beihaiensis]